MPRWVAALALVLAIAVGAAAAAALVRARDDAGEAYRGSQPPGGIALPHFLLRDERGARVDSRSLRGKAVLVTFLDSRCRAACPLIAAAVARGVAELPTADRTQMAAFAITTDPASDTPAAARAFLARYRASGRLRYLLGNEAELRSVWHSFAVLPSIDTGRHEIHSAPVRIYDRDGTWVATQNAGVDLTPANVAHDLRLAAR